MLSNPDTFKSIESDVLNQFPSIMKNYTPINKATGQPQKLSTYIGNILGRRVGPKLVEDYAKQQSTQSISNDQQKELESIQDTSKATAAEIDTDVKLVDNIKINKQPLSVEFKDNNLIAWQHLLRNVWRYELQEIDPNTTLVTETWDGRNALSRWWVSDSGEWVPKAMAKTLVKLKVICESEFT